MWAPKVKIRKNEFNSRACNNSLSFQIESVKAENNKRVRRSFLEKTKSELALITEGFGRFFF